MQEQDSRLAEACRTLDRLSAEAAAWVNDNQDVVRGERDGLLRELRRAGRLFRTCGEAARRKMCAGVFGPSQAGKSYLISALARNDQGELMADFAGQTHDFITSINPAGGKESTGLVTRFTTTAEPTPAATPVRLQLLTETDLVKILANTYYADCEHAEPPDPTAIDATLNSIEKSAAGLSSGSRVELDDLEDLREYLEKDFRAKPRVQELERGFWSRAFHAGPHLDLAGRIRLYSLIWNETPGFTALLSTLLQALEQLGHAAEAFAPMQALIPRDNSIIDVATLQGLENAGASATETLELVTAAGARAVLPRCVVTALTAELTIVMRESPDPLFVHTDLLDFPGYRSRYKLESLTAELKKPDMLKELFLRGKVAFLFQRYCARRELTSMLLCIGPGNQEVQDLPGVINDWVLSTHGETPERREGKAPSLYFVLTKFDMEFEQKKGEPSVAGRWDTRLHSSLLGFFGKQHDWPTKWTPTQSFNNLFLLRNPNFSFDAILSYAPDRSTETGIRPDQQPYVDELASAFLNSALVAQHFADPRESWDAAMKLNDGGIGLIRSRLHPLCDPEIKRRQIVTTLLERQERLVARLKPFWKSDDRDELRQEKTRLYKSLAPLLARQIELGHFAELLSRMGVQDHDLYEFYFEAEQLARRQGDTAATAAPVPTVQADSLLSGLDDLLCDTPEDVPVSVSTDRPRDAAAAFAALMESKWLEHLHAMADDPVMQAYYPFPGQEFTAFVNELAMGADRQKLRQELEDRLRRAASYANVERERLIWKQASLAAGAINAYISWLGFNPRLKTAAERTMHSGGRSFVLFEPTVCTSAYPELPEMPSALEKQWYSDWLRALYQLIMDNVNFDGEQTINTEENNRIGRIIRGIAPQQERAS